MWFISPMTRFGFVMPSQFEMYALGSPHRSVTTEFGGGERSMISFVRVRP